MTTLCILPVFKGTKVERAQAVCLTLAVDLITALCCGLI